MNPVRERLRATGRWSGYLLTFEGHEALGAFLEIEDEMEPPDYWRLLGDVWMATDVIAPSEETWRRLFSSDRPGRENLMKESERARLADLPDEVTAYRGFSHDGGARGLAWTLDLEQAHRFARGFANSTEMGYPPAEPQLATVTIPRSEIIGLFEERREGDIVILELPQDVHVERL